MKDTVYIILFHLMLIYPYI